MVMDKMVLKEKAFNAFKPLKAAVESLYSGTCSVSVSVPAFDESTKQTTNTDTTLFTNQPCRLSFISAAPSDKLVSFSNNLIHSDTPRAHFVDQQIKLFIDPALDIPPGSKISVSQNGLTQYFKSSGAPAVYSSHQEINLVRLDNLA